MRFTGNVARQEFGESFSLVQNSFFIFMTVILLVAIIFFVAKMRKNKRVDSHFKVLNDWTSGELIKKSSN